jgi:hypothetical protein
LGYIDIFDGLCEAGSQNLQNARGQTQLPGEGGANRALEMSQRSILLVNNDN